MLGGGSFPLFYMMLQKFVEASEVNLNYCNTESDI